MSNLDSVIPEDLVPEVEQKLRKRDGLDIEERPKKRARCNTSLVKEEGMGDWEGQDAPDTLQMEQDLSKYDRKRLKEGLRFLNKESQRKVTPRTIEFLNIHKDAYKVALEKEDLEESSLACVQTLDRVYFSSAFYFRARSSDENEKLMSYVNLRRMELLANYGDYLGQELREIRAKLQAKAVNADNEVAAQALGPLKTWIEIADRLDGSDMNSLKDRVFVDSGVLGLDAIHVESLIKEWAEPNRRFHNRIREHIIECRWLLLAEQMCRDLKEICNVEPDAKNAANYEEVIRSLMNEYFVVLEERDPYSWYPNAKAMELGKQKVAKSKRQS